MTEHADHGIPPLQDDYAVPAPSCERPATDAVTDPANSAPTPLQTDPLPSSSDVISYTVFQPGEHAQPSYDALKLPDDLRISWSWVHLVFFLLSSLASFIVLPVLVALGVQAVNHKPQYQFQELAKNPSFLVITQVLCFAAIIFFLYMTLGVLRGVSFWSTVGWRKLNLSTSRKIYRPWIFPLIGGGLAIFVAVGGSRVKDAENAPIEQLFKDPHAALLLMAMAVLIAPLVEETVFRGYLYPLFGRAFAKLAAHYGADSSRAVRFGMTCGILLTGLLFGMLHGWQLGWNVTLVSLLTLVGVIFTLARAITGTVLASFLMHLGYNSLIAVITFFATKGFTVAPPVH